HPTCEQAETDQVWVECVCLGNYPLEGVCEISCCAVDHFDVTTSPEQRGGHVLHAQQRRAELLGRRRVDEQHADRATVLCLSEGSHGSSSCGRSVIAVPPVRLLDRSEATGGRRQGRGGWRDRQGRRSAH